ncbi:hypothetical protein AeNC1_010650, partial [Aphanomyces euteiches]
WHDGTAFGFFEWTFGCCQAVAGTWGLSQCGRQCNARLQCVNHLILLEYLGWTALYWASERGHLDVVQELLARGASVDAADDIGRTALHLASWNGHLNIVQELLTRGASVDAAGNFGWTALHLASSNGHLDVVKQLLARGASVDAADFNGETALHAASENGHLDVIKELLARGASVDVPDKYGNTALHLASIYRRLGTLKVLLDAGANTNLKNEDGKTARDLGCDEVKALLDNYFQPKIYSFQSATDWIRQTLDDIKERTSDLIATGSVVLDLSLDVKIHRQQILSIGVLVADVLRHTTHQDPLSEHQALLSVLKNIETYFQSNLPVFQPWTLQANAHSVSNVPETISHLKEELIKATPNSNINPSVEVLGSAKEDLKNDLAKTMDKLENIDKCLEKDPEKPDHEQIDVFVELVIQLQRGLEYYELQIALGNIQQNDDFEYLVSHAKT